MAENSDIFTFDENKIPTNTLFGDTYYSKMGGLEETYEVFIRATKTDELIRTADNIVIGETGFGTGLNFLAVLKEFETNAKKGARLHFYTFEKYLMGREIAQKAHANFPEIAKQSEKLLKHWPPNVKGLHSIEISDRVFLNIFIGDANETMKLCDFKADAWFLDGFAPSKNPDFWNADIFSQIARLIKANGLIGTYSVASIVRDGLSKSGFEYEKLKGFANKKHRLIARPIAIQHDEKKSDPKNIIIIGGGIAGLSVAHFGEKFGFSCTLFDGDLNGDIKASNNPRGICMPRLDRLDTIEARFFKTAYLHALRFYQDLGNGFESTKIKEPAKNQRDIEKFEKFKSNPPLPEEYMEVCDNHILHEGALIEPPLICQKLRSGKNVKHETIVNIKRLENGWAVFGKNENELARADILIIAAGAQTKSLLVGELPLSGREGVVSIANFHWPQNKTPIASGGYAIPFKDQTLFGATFERVDLEKVPEILKDSHKKNIETIAKFDEDLARDLTNSEITGRASMRVVSKDKLPIAGEISAGLYVLGALGSRGFSLAPFLAQMIISKIADNNLSVETPIASLICPKRFGNLFSNI